MKIKLIDFNGPAPVRAHDNDAGADVFSPRDQTIYPGQVYKLPLGFGLELPDGYVGYIFPRSSLCSRYRMRASAHRLWVSRRGPRHRLECRWRRLRHQEG